MEECINKRGVAGHYTLNDLEYYVEMKSGLEVKEIYIGGFDKAEKALHL